MNFPTLLSESVNWFDFSMSSLFMVNISDAMIPPPFGFVSVPILFLNWLKPFIEKDVCEFSPST